MIEYNEYEQVINQLVDQLPYPFLVSRKEGDTQRTLFLNHHFRAELGYEIEEIDTIDSWFAAAYPNKKYREKLIGDWTVELGKGLKYAKLKSKITTKHKGEIWYEVKSSTVNDIHLVAFINVDATVAREQELLKISANKDLIFSLIGHDVRSPLSNLYTLTTMLKNKEIHPDDFMGLLDDINERSFNALELIETSMQWARSNFKNIEIKDSPVHLHALINKLLKTYKFVVNQKGLQLDNLISPETIVYCDEDILTAIIRNFITNALKFTPPKGSIQIKSDGVKIDVIDTGIGMSKEEVAVIFSDKSFSKFGTNSEKGVGIGMTLIKELVNEIDGVLEVESELGKGTRFSLVLPQ